MRLKQTIALVTGGASGIGRAIVERFVAEGARVVIGDIDAAAGRALADRLGDAARFATLDISRAERWAEALRATEAAFGPLNCLVNNAGVSVAGTIASTTEAAWRRTLDVNATGTFLGCQQAIAVMADKAGTIINVASARGQRPSSAQLAYSASKALVLSLTEGIALHCGERGLPIRCNAICPGVVDTPILDEARSLMGGRAAADAQFAGMHLLGRIGRPEEVAAAAAFLASDEASFITGATLGVDGGFRIRDR